MEFFRESPSHLPAGHPSPGSIYLKEKPDPAILPNGAFRAGGKGNSHERLRLEGTPVTLEGMRVVIVEDDAPLRESLALFLRLKGCRVETFGSAEDAGDVGRLGEFGVVISDFLLPGEDGFSFLSRVHKASKTVATVLVTACRDRDFPEETRQAGIDSYIPKPLTTEALEGALHRLIGGGRGGSPAIPGAIPNGGRTGASSTTTSNTTGYGCERRTGWTGEKGFS